MQLLAGRKPRQKKGGNIRDTIGNIANTVGTVARTVAPFVPLLLAAGEPKKKRGGPKKTVSFLQAPEPILSYFDTQNNFVR